MPAPAPAPSSPNRMSHPEYMGQDNRLRIVIVDLEKNVRAQARQAAHERFNQESANKKGVKKAIQNIWKQGMAREYYEQKYIREATEDIYGDTDKVGKDGPNLLDNEAFGVATDLNDEEYRLQTKLRFAHEHAEQLIQEEAGESYQRVFGLDEHGNPLPASELPPGAKDVQNFVVELGEDYLFGAWSTPEDFEEHKRRKMKTAVERNPDIRGLIGDGVICTDNLTEVYKNVNDVIRHEIGLGILADTLDEKRARAQELLNEAQIATGEAHVGAYSPEEGATRVERITEKLSGKLPVGEKTIAAAASIAIGASTYLTKKAITTAGHGASMMGIPVAGAVMGGTIAGFREAKALKRERQQHDQAMAENKFAGRELTGRREKLEATRYEAKTAKELFDSINSFYDQTTGELLLQYDESGNMLRGEDLDKRYIALMSSIAEIDARLSISAKEGVNLVQYSDKLAIAKERKDLLIAMAKVKIDTKHALGGMAYTRLQELGFSTEEIAEAHATTDPGKELFDLHFDVSEESAEGAYSALYAAEADIRKDMEVKDRLFRKLRRREVSKAVLKGTLIGATIGVVANEAVDAVTDGYGVIDAAMGHETTGSYDFDVSDKITEFQATDHTEFTFPSEFHAEVHDGAMTVSGPDGFTMDGLYFNEDGTLTDHSRSILESRGFSGMESPTHGAIAHETTKADVVNAHTLLENHKGETTQITREAWNEPTGQQLEYGGISDTGLDKDGNIVISAESMIDSSDAAREAMQNGDMHLLLSASAETQSTVVPVEFNSDGLAVIDKDSLGASMFDTSHGHAEFIGKYMEAASSQNVDANGVAHVEVFATAEGEAHQVFSDITTVKDAEKLTHYTLSYDAAHDTLAGTVPTLTGELVDSLSDTDTLTLTYRSRTALQESDVIPTTAAAATSELPDVAPAVVPPTPATPIPTPVPSPAPGPTPPVGPTPPTGPRPPLPRRPRPTPTPSPAAAPNPTGSTPPVFGPYSPVPPINPGAAPGAALPTPGVGPSNPGNPNIGPIAPASPNAASNPGIAPNIAPTPGQPTTPEQAIAFGANSVEIWMVNNQDSLVPYVFNKDEDRYEDLRGNPIERNGLTMYNAVRSYIDTLTNEASGDAMLSMNLSASRKVSSEWGRNQNDEILQMNPNTRLSIGLLATGASDIEAMVGKYLSQGGVDADSYELNLMVAQLDAGLFSESQADLLETEEKIARARAAAEAAGVRLNVAKVSTDIAPSQFIESDEGRSIFVDALMMHTEGRPSPAVSKPIYAVFDNGTLTATVPSNYVRGVIKQMDNNPELEYVRPHRLLEENRVNQFVNFSFLVSDHTEGILPYIAEQKPETNAGLSASLALPLASGVFSVEGLARVKGLHNNGLGGGQRSLGSKLTALHGNGNAPNLGVVTLWPEESGVAAVVSEDKAFRYAAEILVANDDTFTPEQKSDIQTGAINAKQLIDNWQGDIDLTELLPDDGKNVREFTKVLNKVFGDLKLFASESAARSALQAVLTTAFPAITPADISIDSGGNMALSVTGWEAVSDVLSNQANETLAGVAPRPASTTFSQNPLTTTATATPSANSVAPAPSPAAPVAPAPSTAASAAATPAPTPAAPSAPESSSTTAATSERSSRQRQSFEINGRTITQRQEFGVVGLAFSGAENSPYTGRVRFLNLSSGRAGRPGGNLLFLPVNDNGEVTDLKGNVVPQGQKAKPYSIPPERIDEVFGGAAATRI